MASFGESPLQPGDVVAGSYVVQKVIGEGGMAFVALAAHREEHHRVAIKVLRSENARRSEVVKRFEREQRTLTMLHSEHTLRIYGYGQHAGLSYMLLEYLEGTDLAELLRAVGPVPVERAVEYTLQACHAIAEAHLLGIVHRDLKPGNLFLTRRSDGSPCIKVLDFGISKVTHEADALGEASLVTKINTVMGSPFYMSPEQMLSSTMADARSDIWSLAVTLFELLTKSLPFAANTPNGVCQRIMSGAPTPLRALRPSYPKGLEATIARCLQHRPENRYANIADFAVSLGDFAPAHSHHAIQGICALIAPSVPYEIDAPGKALTAPFPETGGALTGERVSETTVYLPQQEATSGGFRSATVLGATTAAFALGVGLGWVLNLNTDPTSGSVARPVAAAVTKRGSSSSEASAHSAAQRPAVASPTTAPEAQVDDTGGVPIDLDSGVRTVVPARSTQVGVTNPPIGARQPPTLPSSSGAPEVSPQKPLGAPDHTQTTPVDKVPRAPTVTF